MAKILIIAADAEPDVQAALHAFTEAGHQATLVHHGLDALEALATSRFDAICVRVKDPERDGVALARIIRDCPSYADVPLIALAGEVTCREQMVMMAAGIDQVLPSPIAPASLCRAVRQRLEDLERVPSLLEAFAVLAGPRPLEAPRARGAWRTYVAT